MTHVVVLGAGIVGLSCALYAQRRGHRVTLIDPRGIAEGASSGNAGVLAVSECLPLAAPGVLRRVPGMLLDGDSPLAIRWRYAPRLLPWMLRFVRSATPSRVDSATRALASLLAQARRSHGELARHADAAAMLRPAGWLKVFETGHAYRRAAPGFARMSEHGIACEHLDRAALQALEPALAPIFAHGVLHPDCDQIADPQAYVRRYGDAFLAGGGRLVRAEALALERDNGRARAVCTGTGRYEGDSFVIAAGAWSRALCRSIGEDVPLDTERGYHVVLDQPDDHALPARPVYWDEQAVVMSPSAGRLRVTSSVEFAGLAAPPDYRRIRRALPEVARALRRPPGAPLAQWLGFRPSMPDSLPVISRASTAGNCFHAYGHGHVGLTLGPLTGEIVACLIDGAPTPVDPAPFSVTRFHN